MDTQQGAVAPYQDQSPALTGQVIAPSASPDSHTKHQFVQMLRAMVDHSTAFMTEEAKLDAHRTLEAFRRVIVPPEHVHSVVKETDRAPVEDVRLRRAPNAAPNIVPGTPVIDYALLAQYIVAAQKAQEQNTTAVQVPPAAPVAGEVHVITDAPENPDA